MRKYRKITNARIPTYDVNYAVISADKLAEKIQVSDEELKKYYEAAQDRLSYSRAAEKDSLSLYRSGKIR